MKCDKLLIYIRSTQRKVNLINRLFFQMHTQHTQPVLIKEGSPPFCFFGLFPKDHWCGSSCVKLKFVYVYNWVSLSRRSNNLFSKLGYNARIFPYCIVTIFISMLLLDKLQLRFPFQYQCMQFRFWKSRTLNCCSLKISLLPSALQTYLCRMGLWKLPSHLLGLL